MQQKRERERERERGEASDDTKSHCYYILMTGDVEHGRKME